MCYMGTFCVETTGMGIIDMLCANEYNKDLNVAKFLN